MSKKTPSTVVIRQMRPDHFDALIAMSKRIYPNDDPYRREHYVSQCEQFPEGQLVAEDTANGAVVGSASSLIVRWDDYAFSDDWDTFTDSGFFRNHDPDNGRTLYGADLMVDPATQGRGVGKLIYKARAELCRRLELRRIRAGARLAGYHRFADALTPSQYVRKVIDGEEGDPTLSFQLKRGFRVLAVVANYIHDDPASLGYAAVIEWINHRVAQRPDYKGRSPQFAKHRKRKSE